MPTQKSFSAADPAIVPVEGPVLSDVNAAPGAEATRGRKARRRKSVRSEQRAAAGALQEALRRIVHQFSSESESTRRQEIRRIKQAHQFWRGLQYLWWSESDQNWHLPFEQKLRMARRSKICRATNSSRIFTRRSGFRSLRCFRRTCRACAFSRRRRRPRKMWPPRKPPPKWRGLVERNNRIGNLIVDEAFNLWTDGKVGAYVRFVVDGQRFGFHPGDGDRRARSKNWRGCLCLPGMCARLQSQQPKHSSTVAGRQRRPPATSRGDRNASGADPADISCRRSRII